MGSKGDLALVFRFMAGQLRQAWDALNPPPRAPKRKRGQRRKWPA